jgi:hypothetical protein
VCVCVCDVCVCDTYGCTYYIVGGRAGTERPVRNGGG